VNELKRSVAILFGPIPSRRLGRSLGINNIPPKNCSYSCIYCQIGRTSSMNSRRETFFTPDQVFDEAAAKISELRRANERIDYLTFVPDGEPTLDMNLGSTIAKLKTFGIKIAVITNASLIWDRDVRRDLMNADWISLKIDSVDEEVWRKINRPHGSLYLNAIMEGAIEFSRDFRGTLVTETMLVREVNESSGLLQHTADFIRQLHPSKAYVLVPTRPPAEQWVLPPDEERLNVGYQTFNERIENVELLAASEGTDFAFTKDVERELLGILAVHPMRTEAVRDFLDKSETSWGLIERLIAERVIKEVRYSGRSHLLKALNVKG
jgi:wyosine [tRNA(Phe)-imidazoG37] synthetase (radical SAM superfamily)